MLQDHSLLCRHMVTIGYQYWLRKFQNMYLQRYISAIYSIIFKQYLLDEKLYISITISLNVYRSTSLISSNDSFKQALY